MDRVILYLNREISKFGRKKMVNKFIHYQLLDEREEQLINKAGAEFFALYWACTSKLFASVLAPSL